MPIVTAAPRGLQNGEVITEFTDVTSTTSVTYTYQTVQAGILIENSGVSDIYVTVGSNTNQVIQSNKKWRADVSFSSFSIRSDVNSQEFIATTFLNDVDGSGVADTVARSIANKALNPKSQKIVFMGDSLTAGAPIQTRSFPAWFDVSTNQGHSVINSGVGGNTTAQMLARFQTAVLNYKPTHMVLCGGKNDVSAGVALSTVQVNLANMVNQVVNNGIQPILCTVPQYANSPTVWAASTVYAKGQTASTGGNVYQARTSGTSGTTAPTGTGVGIVDGSVTWDYIGLTTNFQAGTAQFTAQNQSDTVTLNAWIKRFAARSAIPCIDFYSVLLDPSGSGWSDNTVFMTDNLHPNAAGFFMMANEILKTSCDRGSSFQVFPMKNVDYIGNFVQNEDFKVSGSVGTTPDSFTVFFDANSTFTQTSIPHPSGQGNLTKLTANTVGVSNYYVYYAQTINGWAIGKTLTLELDIAIESVSPVNPQVYNSGGVYARIREATSGQASYAMYFIPFSFSGLKRLNTTFVIPANATQVLLEFGFNAAVGTAYFGRPKVTSN